MCHLEFTFSSNFIPPWIVVLQTTDHSLHRLLWTNDLKVIPLPPWRWDTVRSSSLTSVCCWLRLAFERQSYSKKAKAKLKTKTRKRKQSRQTKNHTGFMNGPQDKPDFFFILIHHSHPNLFLSVYLQLSDCRLISVPNGRKAADGSTSGEQRLSL